jgi:hypothetical protein
LPMSGTVSASLTAGQCMSGGRSYALYSFALAATDAIAFTVTSGFAPKLTVTTSDPDEHIVVSASQATPVEWLLPQGPFQARVGADAGAGSFSLVASTVDGNAGCVQRYIATSITIIGQTIAAGDCNFGDGTKFDSFGVFSSRPCNIRLQSAAFTPWLWLYDKDTFQINGTTGFEPGSDAVLGLPACKYVNEPIFIWANTDEGESGGDYTLVVTFSGPAPAGASADEFIVAGNRAVSAPFSRDAIRAMRAQVRRSLSATNARR